jgi:predicted nucleic acid-binding protein
VAAATLAYRDRALLPKLGTAMLAGPLLLDTNVFIDALAGRGPPTLGTLLANLTSSFVSGPTIAELSWTRGRLDPAHPDTARVVVKYQAALAQIGEGKTLFPDAAEWARAGELAGAAARGIAGGGKSINTAFDRVELINDAVTATVALRAGMTVVTRDGDFDLFMQLEPALSVLFFD